MKTSAKVPPFLYRVPLDDEREAQLWLPFSLSRADGERMFEFIKSLVQEEEDD